MRAAEISTYGEPPRLVERPTPEVGDGEVLITVEAAGVHRVCRMRAEGKHYTNTGRLPMTPGVDGVGRTPDGTRVLFNTMSSETNGSMAEQIALPVSLTAPMPEGLDPLRVAASVNPLQAAWMSLYPRGGLQKDGRLVVLGATGASGRATLELARTTASHITAVGRNTEVLSELRELGLADTTIALDDSQADDELATVAREADVCVDFVWGSVAERFWSAAEHAGRRSGHALVHVQVGTLAGNNVQLPGSLLRHIDLRLIGSAPGAYSYADLMEQMPELLRSMAERDISVPFEVFAFDDLDAGWANTSRARTVFDLR